MAAMEESLPQVKTKSPPATLEAAIDFMGGVAGGTASVYVGQPLDTVKVKLQTFPTLYKNAVECFLRTLREEGVVRGLYAGTVPSVTAQVAENSVLFMCYGMCQKVVLTMSGKKEGEDLGSLGKATAGGLAAFFSTFTLCPTELVKCKLQAMKQMVSSGMLPATTQIGPWILTKQIMREEGPRGFFRGLVPTFAREMPGYFFFFGGYEVARNLLAKEGQHPDDIGPLRTMVAGGFGGMALWTAIFPADVVKSRVQVQTDTTAPKGFIPITIWIARNEGVLALYKGLGPTLLRTFPATGTLFLAYETTKKVLTRLSTPDTT